jgi:hypothetical protein
MTDNYAKIVQNNLDRLYTDLPRDLVKNLPGEHTDGDRFIFDAFGEKCVIERNHITLGNKECSSILGILLSLYALHTCSDICVPLPLKAFKEFPDSMPYIGAFTTHTEQLLAPYVDRIKQEKSRITKTLKGEKAPSEAGGDCSFIVYPLPKIALCYIFYDADDDFPASVTCLFSNNANQFMPIDGLADVGEYTSRKILEMVSV